MVWIYNGMVAKTSMDIHYKFKKGNQNVFLKKVEVKSGLSVDSLAYIAGISPRTYRDWRREKNCISRKAVHTYSEKFHINLPENESILFDRWKNLKKEAARVGGKIRSRKYGSPATQEGRSKGGKKSIKLLRERGSIPKPKTFIRPGYSEDLAELVGILLGDGGITKDQIHISLNSKADREYLPYVIDLIESLFGARPKYYHKIKSNVFVIYLSGINLIKYLKSIGLKVGNKIKQQVCVPDWIFENNDFSMACLMGLMDTDGCIANHRYKVNGKEYSYAKLVFSNRSMPLIRFAHKTLQKFGFNSKLAMNLDTKRVWLYNQSEVMRYLEIIGSHNNRLLKYKISTR